MLGMGGGIVSIPIMMIAMDAKTCITVNVLEGIVLASLVCRAYAADRAKGEASPLIAGGILGGIIAPYLLIKAPLPLLQGVIALLLVSFVLLQIFGKKITLRLPGSVPVNFVMGILAGAVNNAVSMGGSVLGAHAIMRGWSPSVARGTFAAYFGVLNLIGVITYVFAGLVTKEICMLSAICVAGDFIGAAAGFRLGRNIRPDVFKTSLLAFLTFAAAVLIYRVLAA